MILIRAAEDKYLVTFKVNADLLGCRGWRGQEKTGVADRSSAIIHCILIQAESIVPIRWLVPCRLDDDDGSSDAPLMIDGVVDAEQEPCLIAAGMVHVRCIRRPRQLTQMVQSCAAIRYAVRCNAFPV